MYIPTLLKNTAIILWHCDIVKKLLQVNHFHPLQYSDCYKHTAIQLLLFFIAIFSWLYVHNVIFLVPYSYLHKLFLLPYFYCLKPIIVFLLSNKPIPKFLCHGHCYFSIAMFSWLYGLIVIFLLPYSYSNISIAIFLLQYSIAINLLSYSYSQINLLPYSSCHSLLAYSYCHNI